tara:strand:- start:27602 stop:28300 length:699 start_codon:yes stop_codon:yes gene_type:complete
MARRKRKKNHYFTKEHELAIVEYATTKDRYKKEKLYEKWIQPAFNEMVDKICYTYKFTSLPNSDYLRDDCKLWLVTILEKYDASRGHKAFSYFSVVTKNWFIQQAKKNAKRASREIDINDVHGNMEEEKLVTINRLNEQREAAEFWQHLLINIDGWLSAEQKTEHITNDARVLHAIKTILENPDDVEILNKKAIFLYLRELTGLNTKQIATSLKKYRERYRTFKHQWNKAEF